jgi:hypothetical protein
MSSPARPDAASMTAIRGLLERNLVERAVALSETRWPGSGPLVELAHEWAVLSPGARRERLASIGPDELARLRSLGQLNPDLARVLTDLEARGIIPPENVTVAADPIVEQPDPPVVTFEEAVADAALDYSEQGLQQLAASVQEDMPPNLDAAAAAAAGAVASAAAVRIAELEAAAELARSRVGLGTQESVEPAAGGLSLPSAEAFLAEESERRQRAADQAASILDRVRSRVDQSAERLLPTSEQPLAVTSPLPEESAPIPLSASTTDPITIETEMQPAETVPAQSTRVDSPVRVEWRDLVATESVIELEPGDSVPDDATLRELARQSRLDYVALDLDEVGARTFFGGLVREGRRVEPRAGLFPTAVSQPNLVAVRGRLYPKAIERLRAGFCDIPGTQATVRVHPESRIIVIPS